MKHQQSIGFQDKLRNYIRAGYPLLSIKSHEESRVVRDICGSLAGTKGTINIYTWDAQSEMLKYEPASSGSWSKVTVGDYKLQGVITTVREKFGSIDRRERAIVIMKDFHPYIGIPGQIRFIRNSIDAFKARGILMIFLSPVLNIPVELERDIQILDYHLPNTEQIDNILESTLNNVRAEKKETTGETLIEPEVRRAAVEAAKGMTFAEIQDAFSLGVIENKTFQPTFVDTVFNEKVKQVKRHGLLQYLKPDVTFKDIGGLGGLKAWLQIRAKSYTEDARKYGLPYSKGVLLAGVSGCGKTMLAKATANELGFPLFQLDIGGLFDKHVGGSEENFRRVVEIADNIGRCVLFIDEIEKALNRDAVSGRSDSGTSSRAFATLLTWMSERKSPVFLIGTSNDHNKLPTEFVRKGRWDELFWVDLPEEEERREIFRAILIRVNRKPEKFEVKKLAAASTGFTGAEIENVITSAMFNCFADGGKEITTSDLMSEIEITEPMSEACKTDIDKMRQSAAGKLRIASSTGGVRAFKYSGSVAAVDPDKRRLDLETDPGSN